MANRGQGKSSSQSGNGSSKSGRSRNGSSRSKSSGSGKSKSNGSSRGSGSQERYDDYTIVDPKDIPEGPDVLIDVPVVKVDEIDLEVEDLRAQVAVSAEVRDLVQLSVGVDARLGKVELTIEGVEAQALLKARLDNVTAILERVLLSLDRNPELLSSVGRAVADVGHGAGDMLGETGEAVDSVGSGAKGAVQDVGQGAGQAAGQIGQGAGQAVGDVGQGAGQAAEQVGGGAAQGVAGVGQGAGQAAQKLGGQ